MGRSRALASHAPRDLSLRGSRRISAERLSYGLLATDTEYQQAGANAPFDSRGRPWSWQSGHRRLEKISAFSGFAAQRNRGAKMAGLGSRPNEIPVSACRGESLSARRSGENGGGQREAVFGQANWEGCERANDTHSASFMACVGSARGRKALPLLRLVAACGVPGAEWRTRSADCYHGREPAKNEYRSG